MSTLRIRTPIEKIDDLNRDIEQTKIYIETSARVARNIRVLSMLFAFFAIASSALTLSPYVLASDDAHYTFSMIFGIAFLVSFGGSFIASSESKEKKAKLSELRSKRKYARIEIEKSGQGEWVAMLWSYHGEVASTIDDYRAGARKYRAIHNRFQFFIIVASSLVTFMATASASIPILTWGAAGISFLVASATGITGYFKYRERAVNLQRTADELEREYNSVDISINQYRRAENQGAEASLREFAEKAELIKNEQRKREQQLEQSPEIRSGGRRDSGR
ncbi:DUF4231 domain-containing protein [Nocardiopsis dassonvillei]|uniref:DUF4231 domain-containing protein n=1 Tax=Nocardiopsis dassonvillei TaxID=2014 RepID=UPI00366B837B